MHSSVLHKCLLNAESKISQKIKKKQNKQEFKAAPWADPAVSMAPGGLWDASQKIGAQVGRIWVLQECSVSFLGQIPADLGFLEGEEFRLVPSSN